MARQPLALQLTQTTTDRLELVNLRQSYLDELERRHPDGLHAWLRAGARPASDLTRHLQADRSTHETGSDATIKREPGGDDAT